MLQMRIRPSHYWKVLSDRTPFAWLTDGTADGEAQPEEIRSQDKPNKQEVRTQKDCRAETGDSGLHVWATGS